MASRAESLLFVVDVQVKGAAALAALDAELAALSRDRAGGLLALRDAATSAANGHRDLAVAIDEVNRANGNGNSNGAAVPVGNGNGSGNGRGADTAIWGARGPKHPGSKVNPMVFVKEAGAEAGMGALSADTTAGQAANAANAPAPPPSPAPSESNPTMVAAEAVARRMAMSEDDRLVEAIRSAAMLRRNVGASPLLTSADAVRAAQAEPGMAEAISLVQAARGRRAGGATPVLSTLTAGAAASRLGIPVSRVRELAGTGVLAGAQKQGGQWVIPEQAVVDMIAAGGGGQGGGPLLPVSGGGGDRGGGGNFWQRLLWGTGMWGLAGAGTLGSLGGFDPMHIVTTGLGIAGSAATAVGGASLLALGSLGQLAVGGGSDMAVSRAAYSNAKNAYTAYENLQTAVLTYGKNSVQARQAQQQLNATLKDMPPIVAKASLALAKQADALGTYFQKTTAPGQLIADSMYKQALNLAREYVPLVAQAATRNLTIIRQALQPLFAWLEGPHGIGIFQNLENNFAHSLPYAMGAFRNGMELVLRVTSLASNYTGGFVKWLDHLFTRLNGFSDQHLNNVIGRLIGDFRIWEHFVKQIGLDLYYLFRNDAGTGQGIILTLTTMLQKLGEWEKSVHGGQQLHTIFEVHKQEVLALLHLLPPLLSGLGSIYMTLAPAVTRAVTGILGAVVGLLNALVSLGPVARDALGALLLSSKVFGFGATLRGITGFVQMLTGAQVANARATKLSEATVGQLADALAGQQTAANAAAAANERLAASNTGLAASVERVQAAVLGETATVDAGAASTSWASRLLGRVNGGFGVAGGALAARATGGLGTSEVGGGLAVAGLAPLMSGVLAGGAGILGGSLIQGVTGLRGGLLGTLGGGIVGGGAGAALGSAVGALGGPLGIALGAGVGATFGPTIVHLLGSLFGSGTGGDYGKRFADGWMKSFEGIVTVRQGQLLRQQVINATNQLNRSLSSHPRHMLGTRGEVIPLGPSAQQTAGDQYAYGVKIARDFLEGMSSVPYASTSGLIVAFDQQLKELPRKAGAEGSAAAAETMLQFAQTLVSEGRLPKDAIAKIIPALEQQFPALTSYLKAWGAGTSEQVAAAFRLTQARDTLEHSLTAVRQDFVGASSDIAKTVTAQNLFPNLQAAMAFLKDSIKTSTGQAKQEAISALTALETQAGSVLSSMAAQGGTHAEAWAANVQAAMKAAGIDTGRAMQLISKELNSLLGPLGAAKLPLPVLGVYQAASIRLAQSGGVGGGQVGVHAPGAATGGMMVNQPVFIAGEEGAAHPEYVLATNPAYRRRNVDLWLAAGHHLGIPGFARGGISAPQIGGVGALAETVRLGVGDVTRAANLFLLSHMPSMKGGVSTAGLSGSLVQMVRQISSRLGWGAGQVQDWLNVIARESGGSMTARNPGSGAYGIAQFINGPGEYAQYGGNVGTMSGQLAAMANYIRGRYGTPAGAWNSELTRGWYRKGGKARGVPLASLFGRQQTNASNLSSLDSLLMGVAPGASPHSLGLTSVALNLSHRAISLLMGNDAASYGVEIRQLDRELEAYRDDQHKLVRDYRQALKAHNHKLAHTVLGELGQVDQAIATVSGNVGQALANQIQARQGVLDTKAQGLGNLYSILQSIESLPKGTNLASLGLSAKVLKHLGLGGAAGLLGTAGTAAGTTGLNSMLEREIKAYRRELSYDEHRVRHLHGAAKTGMESSIQQLIQTILGLQGDIVSNTQAVSGNTSATTSNTGAMTGSVSFSFQGQNGYLASDTLMTAGMV